MILFIYLFFLSIKLCSLQVSLFVWKYFGRYFQRWAMIYTQLGVFFVWILLQHFIETKVTNYSKFTFSLESIWDEILPFDIIAAHYSLRSLFMIKPASKALTHFSHIIVSHKKASTEIINWWAATQIIQIIEKC